MATNYPTSLDTLNNPGAADQQNTAGLEHDLQHANANDAIEAMQARLGITNSAVATSLDFLIRRGQAPQTAVGTTTGSISVDMDGVAYQTVTLTGDPTFGTTNRPSDNTNAKTVNIIVSAGGVSRQISFATGVILLNNTAPLTLGANKKAMITLTTPGPTEAETIASYAAQP